MYAAGLIVIVAFIVIAWGYTAYSVGAPILPEDTDHQSSVTRTECVQCHQRDPRAPRMAHVEFPSCGYCHRLPVRFLLPPPAPTGR